MKELKTLKDICKFKMTNKVDKDNRLIGWNQSVKLDAHELRQEAIKWIKFLQSQLCISRAEHCEHCVDVFGTIKFIQKFFNITNEELK